MKKHSGKIENLALAASAIVTVIAALSLDWGIDSGTFLLIGLALSPYTAFRLAGWVLDKFPDSAVGDRLKPARAAIAVAMLFFTVAGYLSIIGDKSSTAGLVFVSVPVFLYGGSFLLLVISMLLSWAFKPKSA